jgi:hypothetical protein
MTITQCRPAASLALAASLLLALAAPVRAAEGNWLLQGRWVRDPLPCHQEQTNDINPSGIEFSEQSVLVRAPPLQPPLPDMRFEARYEILEDRITVRMSTPDGASRAVEFRPAGEGRAMDETGYTYRRCGGPTS